MEYGLNRPKRVIGDFPHLVYVFTLNPLATYLPKRVCLLLMGVWKVEKGFAIANVGKKLFLFTVLPVTFMLLWKLKRYSIAE